MEVFLHSKVKKTNNKKKPHPDFPILKGSYLMILEEQCSLKIAAVAGAHGKGSTVCVGTTVKPLHL